MRCPESIHAPMTAFFTMGHQRPDANDRVVDVLGELIEPEKSPSSPAGPGQVAS
jgi:hypothetical protein